jgi:putative SOS response-associated peptidase YedK
MCNHYEKNSEVIEWAARMAEVPHAVVNDEGDVVHPDELARLPTHTWPKYPAPILLETDAGRSLALMRWGVRVEIRGATKPLVKYVTNARDDKFAGFTWRMAVASRRCLIPAVAYYEPDGPPGATWEVRFTLREQPMFFIAGLWERDPDGKTRSFTMVTTSPNSLAGALHDRMPLVLDVPGALAWLGHAPLSRERLGELCRPFPAEQMASVALSRPEKPVTKSDLASSQGELFLE